jgi:hypothetical protein
MSFSVSRTQNLICAFPQKALGEIVPEFFGVAGGSGNLTAIQGAAVGISNNGGHSEPISLDASARAHRHVTPAPQTFE